MARLNSPDKNLNGNREDFQAIQGAYEILSDPDRRAEYDCSSRERHEPFEGWTASTNPDVYEDVFEGTFHPSYPFNHANSSYAEEFARRRTRPARGADQMIEVRCTLEESFTGVRKSFRIEKNTICARCAGYEYFLHLL